MPSVCFYFQLHQPYRLRRFSYFDKSSNFDYFDEPRNKQVIQKLSEKCYLPMNRLLLKLIDRYQGKYRVAFSLSGVLLEQLRDYAPEALDSFKQLSRTGCVEFLAETYYHSFASLFDEEEFVGQVNQHSEVIRDYFAVSPKVFRNTELLYSDRVSKLISSLGFRGCLTAIGHEVMGWRSCNYLYSARGSDLALLVKNYQLSDDIAFRFSKRDWKGFPLTADKFAHWIHKISGEGDVVNLFMDYETFGEHHWNTSGIFDFMEYLPAEVFKNGEWDFATPAEVIERYQPRAELLCPRVSSWGDVGSDLSTWMGASLQGNALNSLYRLRDRVMASTDPLVIDAWRRLQTSDHFYYMCTKWFSGGDAKSYFSPFGNPSDAYVYFLNVQRDLEQYLSCQLVEKKAVNDRESQAADLTAPAIERVLDERSALKVNA